MLETAVHDAIAGAAGARFVPFTMHAPSSHGLLVSSLVLVRRAEPVGNTSPAEDNPLVSGGLLLYPRLGDPYRKSEDRAVSFFVRLKVSTPTAVTASLLLLANGQTLATVPVTLPAPNAEGVIDHMAHIPMDPLPVGDLTLRLLVKAGGDEEVRDVPLRVRQ
jgi:hypothetical protein